MWAEEHCSNKVFQGMIKLVIYAIMDQETAAKTTVAAVV